MAVAELSPHEQGQERRRRGASTKRRKGEPIKLDPEPFTRWLAGVLERYNGNAHEVARLTDISTRTIWDLLNGKYKGVHIDIVDRALLHQPTHLSDLYPDLYDFD